MIQDDRQRRLYNVDVKIDLTKSVVHEIIHEKLGYQIDR